MFRNAMILTKTLTSIMSNDGLCYSVTCNLIVYEDSHNNNLMTTN